MIAVLADVGAMQLMFIEHRESLARLVEEAFPDVAWTLMRAARAAEHRTGGRYDGFVVDLRSPIPADAWELVRALIGEPVLVLTAEEDTADAVRRAGQLDVDFGLESEWHMAIAGFCRRVRVSLGFRIRRLAAAKGLTPREEEILRLLADDVERHEIAGRLEISKLTVDAHVRAILRKTGSPRAAMLRRALRRGTGSLGFAPATE